MTIPNAAKSGQPSVSAIWTLNRLGFGAMRVTGKGVWGTGQDRAEALRTLKRLPELGVNFIDTADSYGPDVSEKLIREALHPYEGLLIATKGRAGAARPEPLGAQWPARLSARRSQEEPATIGLEQIALWQLHRIDPKVPRDEQFGAVRQMLDEGLIAHAGLSEVSVADIQAAAKVFPMATVQNRYNLVDRGSEAVLDYCEKQGIGFIPWYPLAAGDLAKPGSVLDDIAKRPQGKPGANRAGLDAQAQPGDAAHSRHIQGQASGRKCRGGCDPPCRKAISRRWIVPARWPSIGSYAAAWSERAAAQRSRHWLRRQRRIGIVAHHADRVLGRIGGGVIGAAGLADIGVAIGISRRLRHQRAIRHERQSQDPCEFHIHSPVHDISLQEACRQWPKRIYAPVRILTPASRAR